MARSKVPNPSQRVAEVSAGAEGAGGKETRLEEPAAVILAGDILRWVIPKVGKFPKNVRRHFGQPHSEEMVDIRRLTGTAAAAAALLDSQVQNRRCPVWTAAVRRAGEGAGV
jgi:hypothetical protein